MATGQTFLSLNNSRRQRGLHSNHHNSHAFHHNANPFQNQLLNPLARAYHHLTATIPNATQPHHFHHNNAFHNAKTTDLHEDDSLSSVSMLSSDQTKRKVRWILSLGLLLPALAAIIGVVAWAVSAEVVMGVQREAALKNQQEFHNHGPDDFLLDQLETRKLSYNSDRFKFGKQRTGPARNVFGERINPNIKSLASTESKDNLIPSTIANSNSRMLAAINGNTDEDPNGNGVNQEGRLTTKLLPTTVKEAEANEKEVEEVDLKSKNSLENQNLQLDTAKDDRDSKVVKEVQETNKDRLIPIILPVNNKTDLNEEKNDENDANEENNNSNDNTQDEKITSTEEKPGAREDGASNDDKQPDSINEQLDSDKSNNDENEETSTPPITTKLTTTKMQTTSSISDGNGEVRTSRKTIVNEQSEQKDPGDLKPTTKKSAGAQVAEVIDKIVAQRNGQAPPHIVVVAPFRLKNGNKRLTVTEGNVHGIPTFGSRSISAQNLAGFLSKGNKATSTPRQLTERTTSTSDKTSFKPTESTTPSTTTTEEVKSSASLDNTGDDSSDEAKNEKVDEEVKTEENSENNENTESVKEKEDSKPSEKTKANSNDSESNSNGENKENDESKSDDEDTDEDEESPSTTSKPVLINRIKEAVRNQAKKDKQLAGKKENQKRTEKTNENLNLNASTKHKDREEQPKIRTRSRKTSPRKNADNSISINHEDPRNITSSIVENIRRIDEELPERLISLDLTKDEGLFLEDGANAASSNQIQRSMNVNSGMNQLNHLKMSPNQRTVHIPKQQLIQHIQMLSNLNSKHTFPTAQSPQLLFNQSPQQTQNSMNSINIIPTPSISPEQFVDLSQMMNYQEQNLRNLQNLQGMESGNSFMDSNNHIMNVQPTKPQIHYADQPVNHFTDASNINPTNIPPPNANNLQAAESIGHSQHSAASSNMLSVGDPSNAAVVNFNLKEPPGADKGLHMSFGSGPSSGGAQLITNPLGIFKSIFLPLLPKPRMNLNGKVVFGVVLDTSLRKPAPKHAPVIVVPPSKPHHFFG